MTRYKVMLTGYGDDSEAGIEAFLERFGQAYHKTPAEARVWIARAGNLLYTFEDSKAAGQARAYLESLGAKAEVVAEEEAYRPNPPPPAPGTPAGPGPGPGPSPAGSPPAPGPYPYPYPVSYVPPPTNYLKYWDLGTVIGDSFDLLFKNLGPLIVFTLIPMVPGFIFGILMVFVMVAGGALGGSSGKPQFAEAGMIIVFGIIFIVMMPVLMYVGSFCQCAMTLAIAEAINGRKPLIGDCMRRVWADFWLPIRLFVTGLLPRILVLVLMVPTGVFTGIAIAKESAPFGVIAASMFALTLPLMFYMIALFMFIQPVVVLDGVWLTDALQRSMDLGRGWRLRNLAILSLFMMITMVVYMIASLIPCLGGLIAMAIQLFAQPLLAIVLMVLYFDMRLRRQETPENYPPGG